MSVTVTLLQNQNSLLFSLFIFSFISQLIWVCLDWNLNRWFSIQKQVNGCTCTIDPFYLYFCTSQHSYPVPLILQIQNCRIWYLKTVWYETSTNKTCYNLTTGWSTCRCQDIKHKRLLERWVPGKTTDAFTFTSFLWDLDNKSMGILYMASYCIKVKGNVEYW